MRPEGLSYSATLSEIPLESTCCFNIIDQFKEATYGTIHQRLSGLILKSLKRSFNPERIQQLMENLKTIGGHSIRLPTSDGASIDGMYFFGKDCSPQSRTIILFNGTWFRFEEYGSSQSFNLKQWLEAGYNVLVFNYRGVGNSKGRISRDGLVLDGKAAVKFVRDYLRVKADRIILHGHSLGGGIAAEVAIQNPQVCFCGDRSFSSLSKQVQCMYRNAIIGIMAATVIKLFGWEYDLKSNWDKITGKKWILHFDKDPVIVSDARLAEALIKTSSNLVLINMDHQDNNHTRGLNDREAREYFQAAESN